MKKQIINIATFIIGLIIGILLLIFNKMGEFMQTIFSFDALVIILSIPISYLILINMHELGHFIFGKLANYKLIKYKTGPFALKYENGKYKLVIEKSKGYDGLCLMIPSKEEVSKLKTIMFYLGGIIVNFVTSILVVIILLVIPFIQTYIKEFLFVFGIMSILVVIINLIPFASMSNPTDGLIIWGLIKNSQVSNKIIKINIIMKYFASGIRPRDIEELNENINEDYELSELGIYEITHILYNAIDNGNTVKIQTCINIIEKNKEKIPTAIEFEIESELCYCNAFLGDKEKARYYYEKNKGRLEKENDVSFNRIKAYYEFYVNKDNEKSLEYCKKGISVSNSFPLEGIKKMEIDLINNLEKGIMSGSKVNYHMSKIKND